MSVSSRHKLPPPTVCTPSSDTSDCWQRVYELSGLSSVFLSFVHCSLIIDHSLLSPRLFLGVWDYQLPTALRTLKSKMRKPAILQIGDITHAKKEWQECENFAQLKVDNLKQLRETLAQTYYRSPKERRERSSSKNVKTEVSMAFLPCIEVMNQLQ